MRKLTPRATLEKGRGADMMTVYRKECRLLLSGFCGGIPLSLILLSYGILASAFLLAIGYADLAYPFSFLAPCLLLILPGMLLASRVRREGTAWDQLLASLPISTAGVVLGRFGAYLTVAAIPIPLMLAVGWILSFFGEVSLLSLLAALLGYLLFCACLLAAGGLVVSLPRRRLFAGIAVFGLSAGIYLLHLLAMLLPLSGVAARIALAMDPIEIFALFLGGEIPVYGLLWFLLWIVLLLSLQILLERVRRGDRRPSERGRRLAFPAFLLMLSLLLPVVASLLPSGLPSLRLETNDTFAVSGTTKASLAQLKEPVTVTYLCDGGVREADRDIYAFLEEYAAASPQLTLRVLDPGSEEAPSDAKGLSNHSLLVEGPMGVYPVDSTAFYFYYNATLGLSLTPTEYSYCLSTYAAYLEQGSAEGLNESALSIGYQLYTTAGTEAYFDGDRVLFNAIRYVSLDTLPVLYVTTGEGFVTSDSLFLKSLEEAFFRVKLISSPESIPGDADLLLVSSPTRDLTEAEAEALSRYLSGGGTVFLTTSCLYDDFPRLWALLEGYGLGIEEERNLVCESDTDYLLSESYNYMFYAHIASDATPEDFDGVFAVMLAHAIRVLPDASGATVTPWLYTSDGGFLTLPDDTELTDAAGRYVFGAISQKEGGRVIWISSPDAVTSAANTYSGGGNFTLVTGTLREILGHTEESVSIDATPFPSSTLALSDAAAVFGIFLLAVVVPVLAFAGFALKRHGRKKLR